MTRQVGIGCEVVALDRSIYRAVARTPTPDLDGALKTLSRSADHSMLWLWIAGVLGIRGGRARDAAVTGVASIAVASATVNIVAKTLVDRKRPVPADASVPLTRLIHVPESSSFPSGHSASAFAFASAVGAELPALALPLQLLATAVAYSRVHTGVHYPLDTLMGGSVGVAAASATTSLARRYRQRRQRLPVAAAGTDEVAAPDATG